MRIVINPTDLSKVRIASWQVSDEERVGIAFKDKTYSILFDKCSGVYVEVYNNEDGELGDIEKRFLVDERKTKL